MYTLNARTPPPSLYTQYYRTGYIASVSLGKAKAKAKRVIRKWRLERFEDREVKLKYQNALRAEVSGFSEPHSLRKQ